MPSKKKLVLICLLCAASLAGKLPASHYRVNDAAMEAALEAARAVPFLSEVTLPGATGSYDSLAAKNPLVAMVLGFFLGGLGIHRVYLGGRGTLVLVYLATCGGFFGIIPLVDVIVPAICYKDIGQFVGNSKFPMWRVQSVAGPPARSYFYPR